MPAAGGSGPGGALSQALAQGSAAQHCTVTTTLLQTTAATAPSAQVNDFQSLGFLHVKTGPSAEDVRRET